MGGWVWGYAEILADGWSSTHWQMCGLGLWIEILKPNPKPKLGFHGGERETAILWSNSLWQISDYAFENIDSMKQKAYAETWILWVERGNADSMKQLSGKYSDYAFMRILILWSNRHQGCMNACLCGCMHVCMWVYTSHKHVCKFMWEGKARGDMYFGCLGFCFKIQVSRQEQEHTNRCAGTNL